MRVPVPAPDLTGGLPGPEQAAAAAALDVEAGADAAALLLPRPALPSDAKMVVAQLRCCVVALGILGLLRLLAEPTFLAGALLDLLSAALGSSVVRDDPWVIEQVVQRLPGLSLLWNKPILASLRLFACVTLMGLLVDVRHTFYMGAASVVSATLGVPLLTYISALTYAACVTLSVLLRCALSGVTPPPAVHRGSRSSNYAYAETSAASAQLQRADFADAGQASRLPPAGEGGAAGLGLGFPPASGDEDDPATQAQRQVEEARRRREQMYRARS
eukprot:TRINITY_DN29230_c0_g1_i1.p1 TRINITY_DN29230_c0_g1~~TRINITY_DN29230_c0_g1_i1.p1  ORF type:complete len:290 (-),score=58.50 TRINITY_DN29230_c0_g1_i1:141-962(-)